MKKQTTYQDIADKFAKPLKEYYKRRVVIWIDYDKEYDDYIEDLELPNAKIIHMNGSNNFIVKKTLCYDDTGSDYLVYCPINFNKLEDNWIYDIFEYSEIFRADRASTIMDELNIEDSIHLRKVITKYNKFFKSKERYSKIKNNIRYHSVDALEFAILGSIANVDEYRTSDILSKILEHNLDREDNFILQEYEKYDLEDAFWDKILRTYGYTDEEANLYNLLIHLLISAASRTLPKDSFLGLESYINNSNINTCYDFITSWIKGPNSNTANVYLREIEKFLNLGQRFNKLDVEDLENTEIFPIIDEIIVKKILEEIDNDIFSIKRIDRILDSRRVTVWYPEFSNYYDGIFYYKKMYEFWQNNIEEFHNLDAESVWKNYTNKYYIMDTYYRKFQMSFQRSLKKPNFYLDDEFKQLAETVDNLYKNWYLESLLDNWNNVSERQFSENGYVMGVNQQTYFYKQHIEVDKNRKFVIVSDALRYEVADELKSILVAEQQADVEIESMQAVLPSITKFGMAALLPHDKLDLNETNRGLISVIADGKNTDSSNRQNILQAKDQDSLAIKYEDLISMKRVERQDLVKGKNIIYIYHDRIDSTSHTDDKSVFEACDQSIEEIKELVKLLVNDFSAVYINITSDHGFIYTYKPFEEMDKVDKSSFGNKAVELGRRYVITKKGAETDFLIPINLLKGSTQYDLFVPRGNTRFKAGGGLNFVHGGSSLQEMVVPLIKYKHLRTSSKAYQKNKDLYDTIFAEIDLLSSSRKTSNLIFSLDFIQKQVVEANVIASEFKVYFVDEVGHKVSEVNKIIADNNSKQERDRITRVVFNLKQQKYSQYETYYLVIENEDSTQVPKKIPFTIDIVTSMDGFDFFS